MAAHPPELVQGAEHLLQLLHLLSGCSCLTVSIKILGQLCMTGEQITDQKTNNK